MLFMLPGLNNLYYRHHAAQMLDGQKARIDDIGQWLDTASKLYRKSVARMIAVFVVYLVLILGALAFIMNGNTAMFLVLIAATFLFGAVNFRLDMGYRKDLE